MYPWLKRFLLKHWLLEPKLEVLQNRKSISFHAYNSSNLSKANILLEVFSAMSNELFASLQYKSRENYMPLIDSLRLKRLVKQGDLDNFYMTINMHYSPYNYFSLNDMRKLISKFDELAKKMIKEEI